MTTINEGDGVAIAPAATGTTFTISNTGVLSLAAGPNVRVAPTPSPATGNVTVTASRFYSTSQGQLTANMTVPAGQTVQVLTLGLPTADTFQVLARVTFGGSPATAFAFVYLRTQSGDVLAASAGATLAGSPPGPYPPASVTLDAFYTNPVPGQTVGMFVSNPGSASINALGTATAPDGTDLTGLLTRATAWLNIYT